MSSGNVTRPSVNHIAPKQLQASETGKTTPGNFPGNSRPVRGLKDVSMPAPANPFLPPPVDRLHGSATDVTTDSQLAKRDYGRVSNPKPDPRSNPSHQRDFEGIKLHFRENCKGQFPALQVLALQACMALLGENNVALEKAGQTTDNAYLQLPVPTSTRVAG